MAINLNHLSTARLLLERGADPNQGLLTLGAGGGGSAGVYSHPVLLAVARGRAALVSLLLEFGGGCNILIARSAAAGAQKDAGRGVGVGAGAGVDTDTLVDIARQRRDFDTMQALMAHERCHPDHVRSAELSSS